MYMQVTDSDIVLLRSYRQDSNIYWQYVCVHASIQKW